MFDISGFFPVRDHEPQGGAFTIKVVKDCPASRGSVGVIRMTPRVLGLLAGAVDHPLEWGALLIGTRSQGGMVVEVTDLRLPRQTTSGASVRLEEVDVTPEVVGAVHLHPPNIGAFFSQTDEEDINKKFPCSIVISKRHGRSGITESQAEHLLGFCYQAVGKATLPCGALGSISMRIVPSPLEGEGGRVFPLDPIVAKDSGGLGDCQKFSVIQRGDLYERVEAACGILGPETIRYAIFGRDSQFLEQVKAARIVPHQAQSAKVSPLLTHSRETIDHLAGHPIPDGYKRVGVAKYWTPSGWVIKIKPTKKLIRSWKKEVEIDNKRQFEKITEQENEDIPPVQHDDYLNDYWDRRWRD